MSREIRIDLHGTSDLEYHLPNEKDRHGRPIPHREAVTGTDRKGSAGLMSVIGLMPTVVHGSSAKGEPHTLIIFEWSAAPERQGLRFKEVTVEVSFAANGPRGDAEDEAADLRKQGFDLNHWDPEVVAAVPTGTQWYNRTQHAIGGKNTLELGFSAGFAPYFSVGPKYTMERDTSANATDSIRVVGRSFVVGSGRNRPNAVRWTMLENESQRSGVPAFLRTAVLLKRQPDDNGVFLGNISIKTHVSWWQDLMEKKHKLTGDIPPDDAIIFNPDVSEPSSFDDVKDKLDTVDLNAQFQIVYLESGPPKDDKEEGP